MQAETTKGLTPQQEYNLAIQVSCPWCGAVVGQKCDDDLFPQYPHTDRTLKIMRSRKIGNPT
jgi:hypothetical protein